MPAAGVDPVSRRALWEVLLKRKADTAIMLVTHFIDEADILADQVAIMAEGEIASAGSSWQLKQQYSNGYTLQMTMEVAGGTPDPAPLVALVQSKVPGAVFVRSAAAEASMRLPMSDTHLFADLLDELERGRSRVGLTSFSISMPSLEEAFLEAGNAVAKKSEAGEGTLPGEGHVCTTKGGAVGGAGPEATKEAGGLIVTDEVEPPVSFARFCGVAFVEMVKKRFITSVRDKKTVLWALVLPVLAIGLVMCILQINIDPSSPTMPLSLASLQSQPLSALNLPPPLQGCNASALYTPPQSACGGSLAFRQRSAARGDSIDMNNFLLADIYSGRPPQYAAIVFDDPVLRRLTPSNDTLPTAAPNWAAVAAAVATIAGLQNGSYIGAAGRGAALLVLLSKEFQVVQAMQRRFGALPPVNLMHNASAQHALPALLSGMHQSVGALQSTGGEGPVFAMHSHPLPLSVQETIELDSILLVLTAMFLLCPFCLLSGAFTMAPVAERASGAQQIQLLYCPAMVYWAGSYLWDMATHLLVCIAALAIFAAFGDEATTGSPSQALGTFLALILFGAAIIPFCYCVSMAFASPSAAQVATAAINFLLGFCAVNGSYVMTLIPKTQALQKVLVHFFRINPSFLLGEALIEMTRYYFLSSISEAAMEGSVAAPASNSTSPLGQIIAGFQALSLSNSTANATTSPPPAPAPPGEYSGLPAVAGIYSWGILGRPLTLMLLEAAFFGCLVILIDQYKRQHSLPWPLHRVPEAFVAAKARIQRWRRRHRGASKEREGYCGVPEDPDIEMTHQEGGASDGERGDLELGPASAAEDPLVAAEREHVDSCPPGTDAITISHLHKTYPGSPPKVALHDLCLAIRHGERCGILGKNGAGKTTCLSVLTRQIQPTAGDVLVHGRSISARPPRGGGGGGSQLGYCPQLDPLLDAMSAEEHLRMYARLKGVPPGRLRAAVGEVLRRVSLPEEMSRRPAGQYSGGSKRKLGLAIALVGGVSAILLDEPSSGMDPGARRRMWQFIVASTEGQHRSGQPNAAISTVLTTHSMEECEALCSRIAILHQGKLLCLGSPSQLKSAYSSGFILEVHADESRGAGIIEYVQSALGGQLKEARIGSARFVLSKHGQSMSEVFRHLEEAKARIGLHEYGLSQPSLEQVFLTVVSSQ